MKKFYALIATLALALAAIGCEGPGFEGNDVDKTTYALTTTTGCGNYVAPILGHGNVNLGSATITNTDTDLNILLNANILEGWVMNEILVYAGVGPVPRAPEGWVDFGQFPYGRSYYPGVQSETITLSLLDLGITPPPAGQSLNVSIYIVASRGTEYSAGWAYGEGATGCGCFGVTFPYTLCGQPPTTTGCTYTQGYWKTHTQLTVKKKGTTYDWPAPMDEFQTLCSGDSRTLLQLLNTTPASGDAYLILVHQYIAAKLNMASGASSTTEVTNAMTQALGLINAHCGQTVHASTADGQLMVILAGILDGYNNGLVGPGHCSK